MKNFQNCHDMAGAQRDKGKPIIKAIPRVRGGYKTRDGPVFVNGRFWIIRTG